MTIRSVTPIALNLPFEIGGPKPTFAGKPRSMEILLVRVETDQGVVGWGEAFGFAIWPATRTALETLIAPLAVGRDERDIVGLCGEIQKKLHLLGRTGPVIYALSGLDIALWDIAGKVAGKSVSALLGGARRASMPVYSSLMRYTEPDLVARASARAVAQGYESIKLHETGVEQVRAARAAIGASVKLILDTNCAWTVSEALVMTEQLRPFDLYWLEEPVFPPEDHVGLARVRREGGLRIAAGENAISVTDFRAMFGAGAVDFAQPSMTKIGGITEFMHVAQIAGEAGVTLAPHSPYFGPGLLATLHAAAVLDQESLIEYSFCELGASPLGEAIAVKNGRIQVPDAPGLGRDPDPEVIARYQVP